MTDNAELIAEAEKYIGQGAVVEVSLETTADIVRLLLHAVVLLKAQEWELIETAPKGIPVLCFATMPPIQRVDDFRKHEAGEGWWRMLPANPYTHWRPLPAPPKV